MQIVIDIDDNLYTRLFDNGKEYAADMRMACVAIRNGTQLPKGHGRLIDKDKMIADFLTVDPQYKNLIDWCLRATTAQPTIIEADKAGEEE